MEKISEIKLEKEQESSNAPIVGVDLAKESFKASLNGSVRSFKNEEEGIQEMIKWARRKSKTEQLLIAYEATGSVSRPFTMQLIRRGMEWVCLFPPAVRAFARSVGKQVKSDKQDARIIEEYARNLRTLGRLHTNPYVTEKILELQEIESTVDTIKRHIRDIKNSLQAKELRKENREALEEILEVLEKQKEKVIERSMELIGSEEQLQELYELYIKEPGVGKELARSLVVNVPELGHYIVNRK